MACQPNRPGPIFGKSPYAIMELIRISKLLSEKGLCSRREADRYIEAGWVTVDGKVVKELGTRARRDQKVELNQQAKKIQSSKITIILNKPVGYISHLDDEKKFKPASSLVTYENFHGNDYPKKFNIDTLSKILFLIEPLENVWSKKNINFSTNLEKYFYRHIDKFQNILDRNKICSEVHLIFKKR